MLSHRRLDQEFILANLPEYRSEVERERERQTREIILTANRFFIFGAACATRFVWCVWWPESAAVTGRNQQTSRTMSAAMLSHSHAFLHLKLPQIFCCFEPRFLTL